VKQIYACKPRHAWQQRLLSKDPLNPAARADWQGLGRRELMPGALRIASRLSIDECREAHPGWGLRNQRWDELARRDLHATRLTGDEEDEIQADVGLRRSHAGDKASGGHLGQLRPD